MIIYPIDDWVAALIGIVFLVLLIGFIFVRIKEKKEEKFEKRKY